MARCATVGRGPAVGVGHRHKLLPGHTSARTVKAIEDLPFTCTDNSEQEQCRKSTIDTEHNGKGCLVSAITYMKWHRVKSVRSAFSERTSLIHSSTDGDRDSSISIFHVFVTG